MPISPRSDQIPPLATRQLLPPSWWRRRSTFSGFLLKQLSYLLLATFLFVPWCPPSIAWTPYLPDVRTFPACNIEHACLLLIPSRQQNTWRLLHRIKRRNGEKSKCGGGRMLLLILRAGRSAAGKTLQRCCLKTINCPLMPPLSTHFVYNSANWIIIEVHHHA